MPEQDQRSPLQKWLDNLQQESWQLELLVSGFVIFLLIGVYQPLQDLEVTLHWLSQQSSRVMALAIPYTILKGAWFTLLINLLAHVLLRGLWISTIGLRYVSRDVDLPSLRMQPRFEDFLQRRLGSFDQYIERLEKVCSLIFAFTFLLVFAIVSAGIYLMLVFFIVYLFREVIGWQVDGLVNLALLLTGLLYTLDFVTLGWLKRQRWAVRWYYPLYRFMGFLTLARLYRPLYYNLVDNRFGRRFGYFLVPYIILIALIGSATPVGNAFVPPATDDLRLRSLAYDDDAGASPNNAYPSLPGKYVENGFLEVFLPYLPALHDPVLRRVCPDLVPGYFTGLKMRGVISAGEIENPDADSRELLRCHREVYRLQLNGSPLQEGTYYFHEHPQREQQGLLLVADIDSLPRGPHHLLVELRRERADSLYWKSFPPIVFWKVD